MRSLLFLVLIAPVLLFTSCEKEVFALNDEVSIGFNSSIMVQTSDEILEIEFTELLEDSRCPPGAVCFWAGQVEVKLKLNDSTYIELGTGSEMTTTATFNGHTIQLIDVLYASDDDFGKEKKCSVLVMVI
jgi:hypothetical protein